MQRIDKYEVLEVIGRGAMGAVYKALHPQFKKYVAIKEILADLAQHPEIQQRFEREAQLLAELPAHPNIVMVRDALVWQGRLYLVMDYIEGGTLAAVVKRGGVRPEQAVKLLDQILSGLEAIHARGIVHRDLKASNILLGSDGTAYLSDFGIAESTKQSQAGDAMATAKCVAPEMIEAALGRNAQPQQADIYAAGILAYEMLLGETKFRHALPAIYSTGEAHQLARNWLAWHTDLTRPAPNLAQLEPGIPTALASIVERMMAKDVNTRYRQASEVRRDLAALTKGNVAMNEPQRPAADDATVPLSQLRQQSQPQGQPHGAPIAPRPQAAPPAKPASKLPAWALPAAGAGLFVLLAVGLFLLQRDPGFTVIVKDVAPNTDVFVNDVRRGIPIISEPSEGKAVGELRVTGLKAGELYALRTGCGELWRDNQKLTDKLTGNNGQEIVLQAKCGVIGPIQEIDLKGPMRLVKAGPFLMGANDGLDSEKPQHEVNLNYDYYIDKYEVTNRQFAEYCTATGKTMPKNPFWDTSYEQNNPDHPVVGVSWAEAQAYAQWAGKQLPTEQEWEKAASWDPNATDASPKWKRLTAQGGSPNLGTDHTTKVGQDAASASLYGVMDMLGNVGEWVADNYKAYPNNPKPDPEYGAKNKVWRGGTFRSRISDPNLEIRTTTRGYRPPTYSAQELQQSSWLLGFRCAARADSPKVKELLQKK